MAQNLIKFKPPSIPVQINGATLTTLASFDVAAIPGGIGNITDCTIFIRVKIVMFENGGGTYSAAWEKCATFRRTSTNNPTLVGTVINGNADGTFGQVGMGDASTFTIDVSTTTIRVRVTPQGAGDRWYFADVDVTALQGV